MLSKQLEREGDKEERLGGQTTFIHSKGVLSPAGAVRMTKMPTEEDGMWPVGDTNDFGGLLGKRQCSPFSRKLSSQTLRGYKKCRAGALQLLLRSQIFFRGSSSGSIGEASFILVM